VSTRAVHDRECPEGNHKAKPNRTEVRPDLFMMLLNEANYRCPALAVFRRGARWGRHNIVARSNQQLGVEERFVFVSLRRNECREATCSDRLCAGRTTDALEERSRIETTQWTERGRSSIIKGFRFVGTSVCRDSSAVSSVLKGVSRAERLSERR
jgi:hypothetical protein